MTRHRLVRLQGFVVLLAGLGLAACGGGGGAAIDPGELSDELVAATCGRMVRCGEFESAAVCEEAFADFGFGLGEDLVAAIDSGSVTYDGDKAGACLQALAEAACDETSQSARDEPAACDETFTGTVDDGGACVRSFQCKSERCDVGGSCTDACCQGTCLPTAVEAAIGDSCAEGDCVDGAFCDDTEICVALLAEGAACDFEEQCGYGLVCAFAETGGTCATAPQAGDPCVGGEDCVVLGLACDFSTVTCEPLLFQGAACDPQASLCASAYLTCDATSMTCSRYPTAGQACPEFQCSGGAYCDFDFQAGTSECKARVATGQACEGDYQCASRFCDELTNLCADEPICS